MQDLIPSRVLEAKLSIDAVADVECIGTGTDVAQAWNACY